MPGSGETKADEKSGAAVPRGQKRYDAQLAGRIGDAGLGG
jgi:hypothetical protein